MPPFSGPGLHVLFEEPEETPEPTLILIADDDPGTRLLLRNKLQKAGYEVITAKNGTEAINRLSGRVAAAVLDLVMPDVDGMECLRHIRRHYPDLSPIMLTASEDVANAVEAMKEGALDYVIKPFNPPQLIALIGKAVAGFYQAKRLKSAEQKLENARRHQLLVASRIQQTLLLGHPPADMDGLEIAHLSIPSQQIDGDFYDFIRQKPGILDVVVADVMGKGIMAAFMGAALKSAILRGLNESILSSTEPDRLPGPELIVSEVHDRMIGPLEQFETFVTLCYGRFNVPGSRFIFVDCGHVRTIHYHHATRSVSLLRGANMPLGFPEPDMFRQFTMEFAPGDLFLFYSDGVTEAANPEGERYDESRLVRYIELNGTWPPETLIRGIRQEVIDFAGTDVFTDDFTCVAVRITRETAGEPVRRVAELRIGSDLRQLREVRDFVRRFCSDQFDENRIAQIEVASTEVVTNIIKHAYGQKPGNPVEISARAFADRIEFDFHDRGHPFDPADIPSPVFDGTRENGMGCYIIAQTVDEVIYFHDETRGKNCARLKIMLSRP